MTAALPADPGGLWVRPLGTGSPGAPGLVCFPHVGGAAGYYRNLALALSPQVNVAAVQYPGRQDRRNELGPGSITGLARQVVDAVGGSFGAGCSLFGHSMGAVVAFEVARELRRRWGSAPEVLFVSGRAAPSLGHTEPARAHDDNVLLAEVRAMAGTEPGALDDPEILELSLPALRADYRAIEQYRYRPEPALDCRIVAVAGDDDVRAGRGCVAAWRSHTTAGFQQYELRGGHFYFTPDVSALAGIVACELRQVGRNDGRNRGDEAGGNGCSTFS